MKGLHPFLVDGLERELIEEVMRQCGDVQIKAADRLGINRNTLHKKLEQDRTDDARAAAALTPAEPSTNGAPEPEAAESA
jgi:DNA-binding NtrC family response regulator